MFVTNAPYDGGTHLPDVTVVAPVFIEGARFFVAARGHHADIGGITPGSMPPFSENISQEGVLFDGVRMIAKRRVRRRGGARDAFKRRMASAQSGSEHRRPEGTGRGVRAGRGGIAPRGGALWCQNCHCLHAPCAGQCGGRSAPRDRRAEGWRVRDADGWRHEDLRQGFGGSRSAFGACRFHRHERAGAQQFQCAALGDQGGGAVCLPLPCRKRHSDECGLPEAA